VIFVYAGVDQDQQQVRWRLRKRREAQVTKLFIAGPFVLARRPALQKKMWC
jgi:transposase-like protein